MTCDKFIQYIDEYLDGELSKSAVEAFEAHLARCEECEQDFKDTMYVRGLFEQFNETSNMPQYDKESFLAKIKQRLSDSTLEKFYD